MTSIRAARRRSYARPSASSRRPNAVLEVEVFGGDAPGLPKQEEIERLCARALASAGVHDGHLAVEFVPAERIAELNAAHRGKEGPTDVLSFPVDGAEPAGTTAFGAPPASDAASDAGSIQAAAPPRELGDVVICPERTRDVREAIVHGVLHLTGMDHETDDGEMLALQAELLRRR